MTDYLRSLTRRYPPFAPRPAAQEIIDANDGGPDQDNGEALRLLREGIRLANGENVNDDDNEDDEELKGVANASVVRKLIKASDAKRASQSPSGELERVKDAAAFILAAHRAAGWLK